MLAIDPDVQISSPVKSSWPRLDEKTVMARLKWLSEHPNLIDQGANGLCGEAAFYHHILQLLAPERFFAMGSALFHDGVGTLGKIKIDPRPDLLASDYSQIVKNRGSTSPPIPPQADWMLLTALRDSSNRWSYHYKGEPDQHRAEGSKLTQQAQWYSDSGLYKSKEILLRLPPHDNPNIGKGDIFLDIRKTNTNHIVLGINVAMILPAAMIEPGSGDHAISLASGLTFKDASGQVVPTNDDNFRPSNFDNWSVSFDYWSWGDEPRLNNYLLTKSHDPTVVLTLDDFQTYLKGAIVAPYGP